VLDEALELAGALEDERLRADALVRRYGLLLQISTDATGEAVRVAGEAVEVFARAGDELGLCRARGLEAWVHWIQGRTEAAEQAWRAAAGHARAAGAERDAAEISIWLATAALFGATPAARGVELCEELIAGLGGRASDEAQVLYPLAAFQAMLGRFEEARALAGAAGSILADYGLRLGANSHLEAMVELLAGDPAAAERALRTDYDALGRIGETGFLSTTAALLARAVEAQGRHDEAYALTEASERAGAADDLSTQMTWRSVRARILAARGGVDEAARLAREAVEIGSQTDWLNYRADGLVDLAFVLERAGRRDDARRSLAAALELYERKGNLAAAAKTRTRLDAAAAV
jgi:tetratricopeptide (TPR) repeat protein